MRLLENIFDSPAQLLQKVERDKDKLLTALEECDLQEIRFAVFDFSVGAYHIVDWIKSFHPELKSSAYSLLNSNRCVGACRDLCNASKHVKLAVEKPPYNKYLPVLADVEASAIPSVELALPSTFRLKLQFADGDRIPMEDVATEAYRAWYAFFAQHGITG
jgi:hypothetical protein